MKKSFFTLLLLFLGLGYLAAQRSISGKISDVDGSPLIGATVLITGTSSGTVTDENGNFTLTVPNEATSLTVTSVGYAQKTLILSSDGYYALGLDPDITQLNEVVVTALGLERNRNELAVSAQRVSGEDINKVRSNNFVSNLSGKVAGLDIRQNNNMGGSTNIILRGNKSITGNNQALFVVDGIPMSNNTNNTANTRTGREGYDYGSSISDINPDDIQSVTVLKGAAAALYGSKGANGVILITTKKGGKDKFGVTINSGVTFGTVDKSTTPTIQKEYGAGYYPEFATSDLFSPGTETSNYVSYSSDGSYGPKFDPNLQVYDWKSIDPNSPYYGKTTAWVAGANGPDKFYETAVSSNQSVSFDGGGATSQYKVGYTRNDEKGMLPNSSLNKNMFSLYGSIEPTKKFKISSSLNFTNSSAVGRYGSGYGNGNPNTNFRQWFQTNVDILELKEAYERNGQNITWNWSDPTDASPIYWDNPYFMRYKNFENDSRNRLFGNITAQYYLLPSLSIVGRAGADMSFDQQEERRNKASVDLGSYNITNSSNKLFNYDLFANFNKNLTDMISLDLTAGVNVNRSKFYSIFSTTNTDLVVDGLYTIANSKGTPVPPVEIYNPIGVDGLFATATVGIGKSLYIDGSIRRDQSTTLPVANNTYVYPSASIGYIFSNILKQDWLNYGKIRASYSEVGNDAPALSVFDVYDKPTAFGNSTLFSLPSRKNNSELKPERTKSVEFGLDMSFLNNLFGFEFSYYDAKTLDQIIPIQISGSTGYTSKFINSGEVRNKGFEIVANFTPIRKNKLVWTWNFNFAKNNNEVVSLYDANTKQIVIATFQSGVSLVAIPGLPYGVLKGRGYVLNDQGKRVVNEDGYYEAKNDQIIGNTTPDWFGGIGTSVSLGELSFGVLVDAKIGGSMYSLDQAYGQYTGMYPITAGNNDLGNPKRAPLSEGGGVILDGVKEDGTKNDIRVSAEDSDLNPYGIVSNPNEAFIYDASYVKLREANITYSLPSKWFTSGKYVKGIDISLVGRNLWIIYKNLPYADPEEVYSAGNVSGHQGGAYPALKTYGFNLRLKF